MYLFIPIWQEPVKKLGGSITTLLFGTQTGQRRLVLLGQGNCCGDCMPCNVRTDIFLYPTNFRNFFQPNIIHSYIGTGNTFSDCWLLAYFSKINCKMFNSGILYSTSVFCHLPLIHTFSVERLLNLLSCQAENIGVGKPCETAKTEL
ncbi:MAG: hypothetical protein LBB41_07895 [Prevotellaceae bacterium]|jgi:hypothetical protein|nr:hypothetical protein [Prevotellaceae bacterium]